MRTSRVYIGVPLVVGDEIAIDKARSHYLNHVLRLASGANVVFFNGLEAVDYNATLQMQGKNLSARIVSASAVATESLIHTEIIQGLGRSDHMDWMIQKTTELGVSNIVLFNAERSQSPLKKSLLDKKLAHWRGVAISACEQCGRTLLPTIDFRQSLDSAIDSSNASVKLLLNFDAPPMTSCLTPGLTDIAILLGPEGGLNISEIETATIQGWQSVSLGPRVLRTETAAVAALTLAQAILGDLSPHFSPDGQNLA